MSKELDNMKVMKGEKVSRSTIVKGETVTMFNVSKNDKTDCNYKVTWEFDFKDVSHDELLKLAAQSAVIAYRKNFRSVSEKSIPSFAHKTIDVKKDILARAKRGKSDQEKVESLITKLSDDEKAALVAQLTGK